MFHAAKILNRGAAAVSLIALGLAASLPAAAGAPDAGKPVSEVKQKRVDVYVQANTVWTLYHELGHALVDLYDLPVLGREEDAADSLANLMMLADGATGLRDQMIIDAAWYWHYADLERKQAGWEPAFWDVHSLNLQRFYQTLCFAYGSEPDRFAAVASEAKLPDDQKDSCTYEKGRAEESWSTLLAPHRVADGKVGRAAVVFEAPGPHAEIARMIETSGLAEQAAAKLQARFGLPQALSITFTQCGEPNAYYMPGNRQVVICYEELAHFATQISTNAQPPIQGK